MKTLTLFFSVFVFLFVCFASSLTLVSCKHTDAEVVSADMQIQTMRLPAKDKSGDYDRKEESNLVAAASLSRTPEEERTIESKIIKSGDLRFQTDDLEKTYNQIQEAVKKYNATVKNDSQSNGDYEFSRRIYIRIPNENFDTFIAEISKGVSYFDRKDISSEDVTEEYIDVASRIKTKKVLEERYLELLKKANKVSEMLEIEGQLSEIREEIEAKEGRLKYLQNKVAMSTLDIEFYKPIAQGQKATVSYGGRIGNAIVSGFNGISNFFISLLGIWPVIVTLVVVFILIRKRFKRKNKKDVIEN